MRIRPPALACCLVLFAAALGVLHVFVAISRADDAAKQVDVFLSGTEGYHTYRIPAVVLSNQQTLLAFCEGRKTGRGDQGDLDLMLRRLPLRPCFARCPSGGTTAGGPDGGNSWQPMQLVYEEGGTAKITIGNPCPVVDRQTGTIWLSFCRDNDRVFITHSTDDGKSWAKPAEITADVKKPEWGWYATGPGHGIQLRSGRLVIPSDCRDRQGQGDWDQRGHSLVFYSDDHGESWKLGGVTDAGMNECQVVELADGSLLLSMRNYSGKNQRAFCTSTDAGMTWSKPKHHPQVYCPTCQSSIQRHSLKPQNIILYSGPGGRGRNNMTIRLSYDEGQTWPVAKVIHDGSSAYSDLVVLPDGTIGCLYERDDYKRITFARFTLDWLTDGKGEK